MTEVILNAYAQHGAHWGRRFPDRNKFWLKEASRPEFWTTTHSVAQGYGVTPALAIPVAHSHLNNNPNDAYIEFSAKVMRAPGLLHRAYRNCLAWLDLELSRLSDAYFVATGGKELKPCLSVFEGLRLLAWLSEYCLRIDVWIHAMTVSPSRNADAIPQLVKDLLFWRECHHNPFLLLGSVKDPRMRHLTVHNVHMICESMPWHVDIWEGIFECSLLDFGALAGPPPEGPPIYLDGGPTYSWPADPTRPFSIHSAMENQELALPKFFVMTGRNDIRVESYLSKKRDFITKSFAAPLLPGEPLPLSNPLTP